MDALPSCDARFQVISPPFRHLLLKHHLLRMNPVALSMFTNYFLSGTWLVDLYEMCYDPDMDYDENHPKKSNSSNGPSMFPGVFGMANSNGATIYPEDDDDLEENQKSTCKGDILSKHLLREFTLSSAVHSALALNNHLFQKPASVVIPWGKLVFRDIVGGNSKTASLLLAGIALQCFTASTYFDHMVKEEWSVNESSFDMPKYSLIELPPNPYFKYDLMNLKLIVLLNAMHMHVCNDLIHLLPAQSTNDDSAHSNTSIVSSSALLHRQELMQYFAQDDWVYDIESLINTLPVAITLCTADLTRVPCLWQYEYVNERFSQAFARNSLALQTGSVKTNNSVSIYRNNNNLPNDKTDNKTQVKPRTTLSDGSGIAEYDSMHMVSLLQRATKTQPSLQTDLLHKFSESSGEVKFGLLNTYPNNPINAQEPAVSPATDKQEFVHMVCMSPVVLLAHDKDDDENDNNNAHKNVHNTVAGTFSFGCLMRWFSSSSSSTSSSSLLNPSHATTQRKYDDDHSLGTFGKKMVSNTEAKIVAVHVDMSRDGAQEADLAYVCMLSFVVSKLFE